MVEPSSTCRWMRGINVAALRSATGYSIMMLIPLHHPKNPDLENKMRYKVKRFSNQKDLLCLLCCVLSTCIIIPKKICHGSTIFTFACIIKYILTFVIDSVPSFRHVDFPGGTWFFYQRGIHPAPQCQKVSSSLCSCGNVL